MNDDQWDIRERGRKWSGEECEIRWQLTPEKTEIIGGKLFWNEKDRLNMLGMLLENVGIERAIKLGNPQAWHDVVIKRDKP